MYVEMKFLSPQLTYVDHGERVVGQGVLAVVVRDGDADLPVGQFGGEVGPGAGVLWWRATNSALLQSYFQVFNNLSEFAKLAISSR